MDDPDKIRGGWTRPMNFDDVPEKSEVKSIDEMWPKLSWNHNINDKPIIMYSYNEGCVEILRTQNRVE